MIFCFWIFKKKIFFFCNVQWSSGQTWSSTGHPSTIHHPTPAPNTHPSLAPTPKHKTGFPLTYRLDHPDHLDGLHRMGEQIWLGGPPNWKTVELMRLFYPPKPPSYTTSVDYHLRVFVRVPPHLLCCWANSLRQPLLSTLVECRSHSSAFLISSHDTQIIGTSSTIFSNKLRFPDKVGALFTRYLSVDHTFLILALPKKCNHLQTVSPVWIGLEGSCSSAVCNFLS